MALPLWPDWVKLYDEWKCLALWVPFTDKQQDELFKVWNNPIQRSALVKKFRKEYQESLWIKVESPKKAEKEEDNADPLTLMSYNELVTLAKEKWLTVKSRKKADVIKALKEAE